MAFGPSTLDQARRTLLYDLREAPRSFGGVDLGTGRDKIPVPLPYSLVLIDEAEYVETMYGWTGPQFDQESPPFGIVMRAEYRPLRRAFPEPPGGTNDQFAVHFFGGA